MSNLTIQKKEIEKNKYSYIIGPFPKTWGNTFAAPIRRSLLNSISGSAITKVRIKGVDHEFTGYDGMKEDVLYFVLNLQKVVIKMDSSDSEKLKLKVKGPGEVKAGDIDCPSNVVIVNPELVIATLTADVVLEAEMTVEKGEGFRLADDDIRNVEPGVIPVSANFNPVLRVGVSVEADRVGQSTDYEKIVLEVETNGAIHPDDALREALSNLDSKLQDIINQVNQL